MAAMVALAGVAGILIVAQAIFITNIINGVFLDKQTLAQVSFLLLVLLLVMLGRAALAWGNEIASSLAATRAKTQLRDQLLAHLHTLGPAYTRGERSGELANTLVEGAEALDAYFGQLLPQVFATGCIPFIVFVVVIYNDLISGLILLFTAPLLPFMLYLVGKLSDAVTRKQWEQMSVLSAHFLDVMQGLTTLKLFGRGKIQSETIGRMSERFRIVTMRVLRVAFQSSLVMELGATLSVALIAVEVGVRLLYSGISFEHAFLVLLLAPEFYQPLRALGTQFHASMSSTTAAERMFDILDQPVPSSPAGAAPQLRESLRIEHVSYAYKEDEGSSRPALCDVTLTIEHGQKVALVGPSGAGKSTLAQLVLRFIEPDCGTLLADDVPFKRISAQAWRKQVAWVPQRPYLFNASMVENIRLGRPEANMDEVIHAAQQAHLHDFVQTLPSGYDTIIGERGARLSGGQAQRLSLARAFLKDAPLLILDEATSNLDSESEEYVIAAMRQLMQGRMALVIAHRLSTVFDADQIVVLNEGSIEAAGTHQRLLMHSPLYQQLVAAYQREGGKV
jgi:ATP-binding cassette subfamily C protein CydD